MKNESESQQQARTMELHDSPDSNCRYERRNDIDSLPGEKPKSRQRRERKRGKAIDFNNNNHAQGGHRKTTKSGRHTSRARQPAMELQARVKKRKRTRRRRAKQKTAVPEPAHIRAYKAAGLWTEGMWSFSQRNKAKALAQHEPEPDVNQIKFFRPQ